MKKSTKIVLTVFLILIIGIFIHPQNVIYDPKIKRKVIEENGSPIKDVVASRIEELSSVNEKYGYLNIQNINHRPQRLMKKEIPTC